MPEGQLQFLGVANLHLMVLNHLGTLHLLDLRLFPYIEFCIEAVSGPSERLTTIYKASTSHIQKYMKETLQTYGVTLPEF